jgi:hypothetical protein
MRNLLIIGVAAVALSACSTAGKVAAAPFQLVGKTAEVAGKTVYYTGKGVVKTGEAAGKGVYYAGKGVYHTGKFAGKTVYHVGRTPVVITDKALDMTMKTLEITETVIDIGGKTYDLTRKIPRTELEPYLKAVESAGNITKIFIKSADE